LGAFGGGDAFDEGAVFAAPFPGLGVPVAAFTAFERVAALDDAFFGEGVDLDFFMGRRLGIGLSWVLLEPGAQELHPAPHLIVLFFSFVI
jgi:hypothetical protein